MALEVRAQACVPQALALQTPSRAWKLLWIVTLPLKCQAPGAWAHGSRAVSSWNDSCYFFPFLPSRSPWSNKYDPPLEDGAMPSARLRKLEVEANNAFDQYRDL